ncbi:hypothetical protein KSP40_PGU004180 [Platanthera guangdongensis]|uniref:Uncharacterized protein n=1 Tax=Platanthera guangdongensis TaxID=2320717 RepID=A0ABR2MG59_9ASPA
MSQLELLRLLLCHAMLLAIGSCWLPILKNITGISMTQCRIPRTGHPYGTMYVVILFK